ncbi:MAG TPA: hypothetical protein VFE32_12490 [Puia sp.]|jgi:hypothetical protein|nr:hypothetical protein [Puia sp.]
MKIRKTAQAITIFFAGALLIVATLIPSCHKSNGSGGGHTFYDSLGGTTVVTDPANYGQTVQQGYLAIRTIVDTALLIIQADTLINGYFSIMVNEDTLHAAPTEYDKLSLNISNFLAASAGAKDYSYTGPAMGTAHNPGSNPNIPMAVDSAAFNEFAYDLGLSARQYGLSDQLISQLGDLLYRYEGQVVQP